MPTIKRPDDQGGDARQGIVQREDLGFWRSPGAVEAKFRAR